MSVVFLNTRDGEWEWCLSQSRKKKPWMRRSGSTRAEWMRLFRKALIQLRSPFSQVSTLLLVFNSTLVRAAVSKWNGSLIPRAEHQVRLDLVKFDRKWHRSSDVQSGEAEEGGASPELEGGVVITRWSYRLFWMLTDATLLSLTDRVLVDLCSRLLFTQMLKDHWFSTHWMICSKREKSL